MYPTCSQPLSPVPCTTVDVQARCLFYRNLARNMGDCLLNGFCFQNRCDSVLWALLMRHLDHHEAYTRANTPEQRIPEQVCMLLTEVGLLQREFKLPPDASSQ